jgi:hypothetical protein
LLAARALAATAAAPVRKPVATPIAAPIAALGHHVAQAAAVLAAKFTPITSFSPTPGKLPGGTALKTWWTASAVGR